MRHPLAVGLVQRVGDLDGVAERLVQRERTLAEPVGQRLALQVLHDQEVGLALPADIEDGADVGMAQRGDRLRFPLEPRLPLGVGGDMRGQDLDGNGSLQPSVGRFIDLTHAPGPEGGLDLIRAEAGAAF